MTGSLGFSAGQILGEYKLRQVLGEGSFGTVWEAENEQGELRALKFLPGAADPLTRQEIKSIQMIAKLEHPHLMPVEKVWTVTKYFVIAMRLAEGTLQDLFDAFQSEFSTGIEASELCKHLSQAALALDFLNLQKHALGSWPSGIQHGDVKPSNLLLFGEKVMLSDFNLASPTSRALQSGTRIGTPGYLAPEVYYGRLSESTDQFSLAVTYCYLRGGRLPVGDKPPSPGQSFPGVRPPPDYAMLTNGERPIINRALSVTPRERWKSCTEMMNALTDAVRGKK